MESLLIEVTSHKLAVCALSLSIRYHSQFSNGEMIHIVVLLQIYTLHWGFRKEGMGAW